MGLHNNLTYDDIKEAKTITVGQDMLKLIHKYYNLLDYNISYDFDTLNIDMDLEQKINLYVENTDDECAIITYFNNGEKLFTFKMEYVFNIGYSVLDIVEYEDFQKHKEKAEAVILSILGWYPMILFYVQNHSSSDLKQYTFFINTPSNKLNLNFKASNNKKGKNAKKKKAKEKSNKSNKIDKDE